MNKYERRMYESVKITDGKKFADWLVAHKPVMEGETALDTFFNRAIGFGSTIFLLDFALEKAPQIESN